MNQRQKKLKKRYSYTGIKLTVAFCVSIGIFFACVLEKNNRHKSSTDHNISNYQLTPITSVMPSGEGVELCEALPYINICSANAVLMDYESRKILFDKSASKTIYPASMTKIMTAIVVLENVEDLNEKVLLSNEIFQPIYDENASIAGFLPDESVRVIDLLYGLLLPSGAECAVGLAEYTADSENEFVGLMNRKAEEIGMSGTNFTNTTGLHDKNHYTTVMDMAVLFRYALDNSTFYEIITSSRYSTPSTNRHDGGITYYSTLLSKIGSTEFEGGIILGGKTGYTDEAGQCLASFAEKDGSKYVLVTSGAFTNGNRQKLHFEDAVKVYASINKTS